MDQKKSMLTRLKKRWGITSSWQVIVILVVFACTGFTTLYLEDLLFKLLNIPEVRSFYMRILILIFVTLPIYNIVLLFYGFIFGQFPFFWNFEKRFFGRLFSVFRRKK